MDNPEKYIDHISFGDLILLNGFSLMKFQPTALLKAAFNVL